MRLEERVLAVDRRTRPEARNPWQRRIGGTMYPDGEDALHRRTSPLDLEVRRREPQTASQPVPLHHPPPHRVRPAKPAAHLLEIRPRERFAHGAAAHAFSVQGDGRYHVDLEAQTLPCVRQHRRRRLAIAPEAEIVADDDQWRPQLL